MGLAVYQALEADGLFGSSRSPDLSGKRGTTEAVTSSGIFSGHRCDPRAFQRIYPDRWHGFLKAHFRNSVEVAAFFDVNAKTARLWWEGSTGPQGWTVDFAHRVFPEARKWMEAA